MTYTIYLFYCLHIKTISKNIFPLQSYEFIKEHLSSQENKSFGRSGYRRRAFRSIFARSVITPLPKDAAPIPNAFGES